MKELARRQITPTPQAVSAILQSFDRSSSELVGDTDSLLVGLLFSGSYTVDVLETAGANPRTLRDLAVRSVWSPADDGKVDPIDAFFCQTGVSTELINSLDRGTTLETSHLLKAAISPSEPTDFPRGCFPTHLRADEPPCTQLQKDLDERMRELLSFLVGFFDPKSTDVLARRREPITREEDAILDRQLGIYYPTMLVDELEFAISALNHWFLHRRVLTDPAEFCLRLISRCEDLLFGPRLFAESGGNLKAVDNCLQMAERFSPERDLPAIALFARGKRIEVGQYTYRNMFLVDSKGRSGHPLRRVHVQGIRPVPLIATSVIHAFERLVSADHVRELEIQAFLEQHPEFLESLGYASVLPHVCLREDGASDLVPDVLLELPGFRGFDILDLKLPKARLNVRSPYLRMSVELTKAVAQLRKYQQFFDKAGNRKAFYNKYGLTAFKPELIVLIGRSQSFASRDERVEIEEQLGSIRLVTYDDLGEYARKRSVYLPTDSSW